MRARTRAWATALVLLLAGGCGPARPELVLLVSIDTLRPDHLGAYGYPRETSPTLDRIASEGVLFETAVTPSPWTLPAHASLLTGLYPERHGVASMTRRLADEIPTLAALLYEAGFDTAGIVNSVNLSRHFGLDRGFVEFHYEAEDLARLGPTRELVDRAIAWLERPRSRRAFLFLHSYDVHSDYRSLPQAEARFTRSAGAVADGSTRQLLAFRRGEVELEERDAAHLIDLYDAGIWQQDAELARLLAFLETSGRLEDTLLVVTSDHGEEFLEHGGVLHGITQYDELLRVPLVLYGPGLPRGVRVSEPVSLIDVVPTILGLMGEPVPKGLDGRDLSPLLRGEASALGERVLFGGANHVDANPWALRSARRGRFKLHALEEGHLLFDLNADPDEQRDVSPEHDQVTRSLARALEDHAAPKRGPRADALSAEQVRLLRSLGYLGDGGD